VEKTPDGDASSKFVPTELRDEFRNDTFEGDAMERILGASHDGQFKRESRKMKERRTRPRTEPFLESRSTRGLGSSKRLEVERE
jgi:hypothetical protein